jgi:hypothetical protein
MYHQARWRASQILGVTQFWMLQSVLPTATLALIRLIIVTKNMQKTSMKKSASTPADKPRTRLPKAYLSCRVSPLVKDLIRQEWEDHFDSEGQAVEALVLRGSTSAKAAERILREAETDPVVQAVKQALALVKKQQG